MSVEKKLLNLKLTQFKFDAKTGEFEGYASVFGGVDSYGDTVHPGAFKETLENRDRPVRLRWNHYGPIIGKYVDIKEDDYGLYVKGQLTPGHSVASDVLASLKHGAIDGLSIGYIIESYRENSSGGLDLFRVKLVEISIVEDAADLAAKITSIKSIKDATSLKQVEAIIRSKGFTRDEATALVSQIRSVSHGEREREEGHGEREHSENAMKAFQKLTNTLIIYPMNKAIIAKDSVIVNAFANLYGSF